MDARITIISKVRKLAESFFTLEIIRCETLIFLKIFSPSNIEALYQLHCFLSLIQNCLGCMLDDAHEEVILAPTDHRMFTIPQLTKKIISSIQTLLQAENIKVLLFYRVKTKKNVQIFIETVNCLL